MHASVYGYEKVAFSSQGEYDESQGPNSNTGKMDKYIRALSFHFIVAIHV